jgi:cation:H+ antiporter
LGILAVLDVAHRGDSMFTRMDQGHVLTVGFGVILIGFGGASLLLGAGGFVPHFFHIAVYTPILIVLYFVAMRTARLRSSKALHRGRTGRGHECRFRPSDYRLSGGSGGGSRRRHMASLRRVGNLRGDGLARNVRGDPVHRCRDDYA